MVVLAAALALVAFGWAAHRLAAALLPDGTGSERGAIALVLAAALVCTGYGILGSLCGRRAADVELVFTGDPAVAPRSSRNERAGEVRVIDDRVTQARATPQNLAVLALLCAAAASRLRPAPSRKRRARAPRLALLLWIPLALSGLAAIWSVPRGYDALWYHLPMAAAFARNHHLEPPGRDLVFYFPANVEILARALFDVLGRALGANALCLVQLPFAIALGPLCTAIARRLGAGTRSWIAGALAVACPMVVFQAGLGYADLVSSSAVAASLLLLIAALARQAARIPALLAAGTAFGLALGAKYAALPLLAAGLPFVAIASMRPADAPRWRFGRLTRALSACAVFLVGAAPPAWFWYARNLRLSGNPVFPIAIPALGLPGLFAGDAFNRGKELELVGHRAEWLIYPFVENLSHESGFGAAFATLVPVMLVLLLLVVRALVRGRIYRMLLPLGWGALYLMGWWLGTPHEVRHLLPLVVLFGPPAIVLLRGTSPASRGLAAATTAGLAVGSLVSLRLQLHSPVPELSIFPRDFTALYGFPTEALEALPAGSRIANLAGRTYNLALLGPRLKLLPYAYVPGVPADEVLAGAGVTHVFVRAPREQIEALRGQVGGSWRRLYSAPASASQPGWDFWGASPTDILEIYARGTNESGIEKRDK